MQLCHDDSEVAVKDQYDRQASQVAQKLFASCGVSLTLISKDALILPQIWNNTYEVRYLHVA
jgi:hypothetical protein